MAEGKYGSLGRKKNEVNLQFHECCFVRSPFRDYSLQYISSLKKMIWFAEPTAAYICTLTRAMYCIIHLLRDLFSPYIFFHLHKICTQTYKCLFIEVPSDLSMTQWRLCFKLTPQHFRLCDAIIADVKWTVQPKLRFCQQTAGSVSASCGCQMIKLFRSALKGTAKQWNTVALNTNTSAQTRFLISPGLCLQQQ